MRTTSAARSPTLALTFALAAASAAACGCDGDAEGSNAAAAAAAPAGAGGAAGDKFAGIAWNSNGGSMVAVTEGGDLFYSEVRVQDNGNFFRVWTKGGNIHDEVAAWEKIQREAAEAQKQQPQGDQGKQGGN